MATYTSLVSQSSGAGESPIVTLLASFNSTAISTLPYTLLPAPGPDKRYVIERAEVTVDRGSPVFDVHFAGVTGADLTATPNDTGAWVKFFEVSQNRDANFTSVDISTGHITFENSDGSPRYHALQDGDAVTAKLSSSPPLPNMADNGVYYAQKIDDNTIKLYTDALLTTALPLIANSKSFTNSNVTVGGSINITSHGFVDNDPVTFSSSGTLPSPLVAGTTYFIAKISDNHIQVSSIQGGIPIVFTTTGTGSSTVTLVSTARKKIRDFTVIMPNDILVDDHSLTLNTIVYFTSTGALPSPLQPYVPYYVGPTVTVDTFSVSTTFGGSAVTITDAGTGTHRVRPAIPNIGKINYLPPGGFPKYLYFYPRSDNNLQGITSTLLYDPLAINSNVAISYPNGYSFPVSVRSHHTAEEIAASFRETYMSLNAGLASVQSNGTTVRVYGGGVANTKILVVPAAPTSDPGAQNDAPTISVIEAGTARPTPYLFSLTVTGYSSKSMSVIGVQNSYLSSSADGSRRATLNVDEAVTLTKTGTTGGPDGDLLVRLTYRVITGLIPEDIGI